MDKSRVYGLLMCVGAAVAGWVFLSGIVRGSYWAIGVPIFIAVAGVCVLVFWIGLTIVTTKTEEPYIEEPTPAVTEPPPAGEAPASEPQDQPADSETEETSEPS